jgi:hypothetical protein
MTDKTFSPGIIELIMLLAGVGLIAFSVYVVYSNLYPVLFWKKATGKITGLVEEWDDGEFYQYEKAIFSDHTGTEREVVSKTSAGLRDYSAPEKGEVWVYYDPEDPSRNMIFMARNFLGVIMLPFGLFLVFMGWPWK